MGAKIPDGRTERPRTEKTENQRAAQQRAAIPEGKPARPLRNSQVPLQKTESSRTGKSARGINSKSVFTNRDTRSAESALPPLNSFQKEAKTENIPESSVKGTIAAQELFKQTAAALRLPQDSLSISLIAFLRFFSFSADSDVLKILRREILASSSPKTAKEKILKDGKILAAVIAFDKGIELSQEALERYARLFSPPVFTENGSDEENSREELPAAEELGSIAKEQSKKEKFLDFLNSLPGKSGKNWIVFPFKINVKGTVLRVFLRLFKRELFFPGESEYVVIDIAGSKRQWRCFVQKIDGKIRADICVSPGLSAKGLDSLEKEVKRFFAEGTIEVIQVRNGEDIPSWMEDLCDEYLPSINEVV